MGLLGEPSITDASHSRVGLTARQDTPAAVYDPVAELAICLCRLAGSILEFAFEGRAARTSVEPPSWAARIRGQRERGTPSWPAPAGMSSRARDAAWAVGHPAAQVTGQPHVQPGTKGSWLGPTHSSLIWLVV